MNKKNPRKEYKTLLANSCLFYARITTAISRVGLKGGKEVGGTLEKNKAYEVTHRGKEWDIKTVLEILHTNWLVVLNCSLVLSIAIANFQG